MAKRTTRTNKQIITLESAVTGNIDALAFSNAPNQNPVIRWEDTTGDGGLKFAIGGTVIGSLGDTGYWVGTGFSTNTIYMSADSLFRSNSQRIQLAALGSAAIVMSDELNQSAYTGIVQVKGGAINVPTFQVKAAASQTADTVQILTSANVFQTGFDAAGNFLALQRASAPATPNTSHWKLYFKSTGLTVLDSSGTETAIGAAGANTALSNLGTTFINSTLKPGSDLGAGLGTSSARWGAVFATGLQSGNFPMDILTTGSANLTIAASGTTSASPGGNLSVRTGNATSTGASGPATFGTGNGTGGASPSGAVTLSSGTATAASGDVSVLSGSAGGSSSSGTARLVSGNTVDGNSGGAQVTTGNATGAAAGSTGSIDLTTGNATFGNSGAINLTTGTDGAGGTRGQIRFQDGTQGTAGHVWTSTDTNGNGAWAAAAGGGANTALSNLASVAFNVDLLPASNGGQGIGSNAKRLGAFHLQNMANIYAQNGVRFYDLDSSDSVTLISHATATSHTLTLPPAQAAGALTNDGSGNLSWTATSGANTTLSNLINTIAIPDGVHLTPLTTLQVNLGSASKKYLEGYINTLYSPNIINAFSGNTPLNIDTVANTATGAVSIRTGAASAGASGGINLITGTATTTQGEFRFIKSGQTTTIGHVWTASATDGTGYWAAGGAGGAATDLSNLTATAINQSLIPNASATFNLGSGTFQWNNSFMKTLHLYVAGTATAFLDGDSNTIPSGVSANVSLSTASAAIAQRLAVWTNNSSSVTVGSGPIHVESGNQTGSTGANPSGLISIKSGNVTNAGSTGASGAVNLTTGNTTGAGASGAVNITTGTAGGTRGRIVMDASNIEIRASIIPQTQNSVAIGQATLRLNDAYSSSFTLSNDSGSIDGRMERNGTVPSGATAGLIVRAGENNSTNQNLGLVTANSSSGAGATSIVYLQSGNKTGGTGASGALDIRSGTSAGGNTGSLTLRSGDAASGSSGSISLIAGTATASRGQISLDSSAVSSVGNFSVLNANANVKVSDSTGDPAFELFGNQTSPSGVTNTGGIRGVTPVVRPLAFFTNSDSAANSVATPNLFVETGNKTAGTGASGKISILTGTSAGANTGLIDIKTGSVIGTTLTTGAITIASGATTASGSISGAMIFQSGNSTHASSGNTGNLSVLSGNSTAAASGSITIQTGTAGTTRGEVIIDASETKVTGGLTVGSSGNSIGTMLTGSGSITVPALLALTSADVGNITVTGLADGDFVYVTPPNAAFEDGMMYSCYVSAADTLTINVFNGSAGTFTGSTQNWRYFVVKAG